MPESDVATTYLRWIGLRAAFHRGYWLVASLYLVTVAELSPFELVFIGTAQGLTGFVFEIPTGVFADAISRKTSIVIAHLLMGASMLITGLVTEFPALVATQMLWGLSWTFSTGADVAWLTDELARPDEIAGVLTAGARAQQLGAAFGMLGFGALAWATELGAAIAISGVAMWALGIFVALRFGERHFTPTRSKRWRASRALFARGVELARRDREIRLVFAATLLAYGAAEAYGRLFPKHLIALGFPQAPDPIVWFTALGLVGLALGALALRFVEARIDGVGVARRLYAAALFVFALGLGVLALAPEKWSGMAAVLLVEGIAAPVHRCVGSIWVNRRATSDVRATVQSFLSQAEYLGEIALGVSLGILAQSTSIALALVASCALAVYAGLMVVTFRTPD